MSVVIDTPEHRQELAVRLSRDGFISERTTDLADKAIKTMALWLDGDNQPEQEED